MCEFWQNQRKYYTITTEILCLCLPHCICAQISSNHISSQEIYVQLWTCKLAVAHIKDHVFKPFPCLGFPLY